MDSSFEGAYPIESERIAALRRYSVLDTPPDASLDRITRLARSALDTPIAVVSLVDSDRQWFKSVDGLETRETPREGSFCTHTIESDEPLVVSDATLDPRFIESPLVLDEPNIRFYAGVPLVTRDGFRIGSLCVLDRRPRTISEQEIGLLQDLAALVMEEIELRRHAQTDAVTGARAEITLQAELSSAIHKAEADHEAISLLGVDVISPQGVLASQETGLDSVLKIAAFYCDQVMPRAAVVVRSGRPHLTVILPRSLQSVAMKFGSQLDRLVTDRLMKDGFSDSVGTLRIRAIERADGETGPELMRRLQADRMN